jgi:hypothetical protein
VELAAPSLGEIALAFSEALHPRVPAGGAGGGEFGSKAAGPARQPVKSQQAKQQKPGIGAGRKAALAKQAASLHARAKADRMQAAELESQLQTLNAAIKVKVQASAKAKTAAKSAAAKAGTAKKAAKVTKATNKAKAGKKATAKKASLPHMRVRRIVLRSKIHDLRSQARALDRQAASIKLAGDDGRFLELAFAEALAERVPSGRAEGGQFHARTSLTRHDTPDERARAVNAMDERQRAAVRVSALPPPGYAWDRADRLTAAAP